MNNEKEMISDERLDQLLIQVDVPAGLHDELLEITNAEPRQASQQIEPASRNGSTQWYSLSVMVVAACYLFLAAGVFVFWPKGGPVVARNDSQTEAEGQQGSKQPGLDIVNQANNSTQKQSSKLKAQQESAAIEYAATLDSIETKLNQLEIQELEAKLAKLESSRQVLESSESMALVLAIADQTPLNLGGSRELVDDDMKFILENFPSSQGAEIAAQVADSGN